MSASLLGRFTSAELCRVCRTLHKTIGHVSVLPGHHVTVPLYLRSSRKCFSSLDTPAAQPSAAGPKPLGHPWRIIAAVCVQRMPVLNREKTELECQYEELRDTMRVESSKLSEFELEELEYMREKRKREKRALEEDLDSAQASKTDSTDELEELQEAREAELQEFKPAPRETEADRNGDMRSIQRKLDRILFLLVKKDKEDYPWAMPQGGLEEGESLIETAARELREECGDELKVDFLSKAPLAYFSYKHPPTVHSDTIGAKVFFFRATYEGGELHLDNKELMDYMWVTKEEMKELVSSDYFAAIAPILLN